MNRLAVEISAEVSELISHYGFDLGGYSIKPLVDYWMQQYPAPWIRLATIEALYQGRYKAISIEQILNLWRRRTRAVYHFNSEFERMISLRPMLSPVTLPGAATAEQAVQPDETEHPDPMPATAERGESSQTGTANTVQQANFDATDASTDSLADRPAWRLSPAAIDFGEIRRISGSEPQPIDQFTPTLDASDFYWRLKAVMQTVGAVTAEEIGRRN